MPIVATKGFPFIVGGAGGTYYTYETAPLIEVELESETIYEVELEEEIIYEVEIIE